ncbi:MAG TPA: ABC transporter permease, partial [Burkholderiaceae bacterium]|nr:ABC transporter permease [Burkholderiaceae bacterium]
MSRPPRRALFAWLQAAPLAAVFVVFFLVPLGLIVAVSFWQATDYELIPAFSLQSYRDIFAGCGLGSGDLCVTLKTYGSTLRFSLLTWAITAVLGFTVAYFLAFHVRSTLWQTVLFILCT